MSALRQKRSFRLKTKTGGPMTRHRGGASQKAYVAKTLTTRALAGPDGTLWYYKER
jgi:hypothetical protein